MTDNLAAHRDTSEAHASAADALSSVPVARPWELVARFYSSIHLINAYLLSRGHPSSPRTHRAREKALTQARDLPATDQRRFMAAYMQLRNLSQHVRYDARFIPLNHHSLLSKSAQSEVEHIVRPYLEGSDPQTQRAG